MTNGPKTKGQGLVLSIGVFGSSLPREGTAAYEEARALGRAVARSGARVICGGYGGVMEAACRGSSEEGGKSLGIMLAGRGEPNAWLTESVAAKDLAERLTRLRDACDAWIFLPRGLGTMLELVWMAESLVKGEVSARPFVLLGDFWRLTLDLALAEASSSSGGALLASCLRFAATPSEAVRLAGGQPLPALGSPSQP